MKVKKIKINLKSLEDVGSEITQVMRAVESGEAVSPKRHEIVLSDFARVYQDLKVLSEAGIIDIPKDRKGEKAKPEVAEEIRLEIVV
jgi:hypothetical protein